jgi:hypothetical protein
VGDNRYDGNDVRDSYGDADSDDNGDGNDDDDESEPEPALESMDDEPFPWTLRTGNCLSNIKQW